MFEHSQSNKWNRNDNAGWSKLMFTDFTLYYKSPSYLLLKQHIYIKLLCLETGLTIG